MAMSPRTKGGILILVGVQMLITSGILWQRHKVVEQRGNNQSTK